MTRVPWPTGEADQFAVAVHDVRELARAIVGAPDEAELEEQVHGRSAARHMVAGYAAAVFETLGSVAELEQVEDELFRFARIVESNADLRSRAERSQSQSTPTARRWSSGCSPGAPTPPPSAWRSATLDGRIRDLVQMLDWLVEQAADARGWRVARVHAAQAIDDSRAGRARRGVAPADRPAGRAAGDRGA